MLLEQYKKAVPILGTATLLIGLYLTSLYSYLLFHSLAEIFSVCVAWALFMILWNSKQYIDNSYLVFIGIAYLFIGGLDILHTLAYKGMNVFKDYDFYANQLWIAARYMESITFLVAFIFLHRKRIIRMNLVFFAYTIISTVLVMSIFYWKVFPICFVAGKGLTPFKIISEYIISSILLLSIFLLKKYQAKFEKKVFNYLFWSLIFTIASELSFTFYIDNYGFSNLVGHYFKIFSFYMIYKAIIEKGINQPYDLIFRELTVKERMLQEQAATDEMTGIYNRRSAFVLLEDLLVAAQKDKDILTICFVDIDSLKMVNDSYGHSEGDLMITAVVSALRKSIRPLDYLCRIGGDEFLLIFPKSEIGEAETIIEKAKEILNIYNSRGEKKFKIDFSYGFAEYKSEIADDIDKLIEIADNNMYKDKAKKKSKQQEASIATS